MERPFLHRKCLSVSSTSRPWPSVLQQPSFLSHYACSSRLGLGLIGNRFPASQPLSSLGSRGGLRLAYSDAWPQFTQSTLYGRIYSVSFVLALRLLVHTTGSCLRSPLPLTLSELRWLGVGSSQSLRVARQMQQMPASTQPTATPEFMERPHGGVLADPASSHASWNKANGFNGTVDFSFLSDCVYHWFPYWLLSCSSACC